MDASASNDKITCHNSFSPNVNLKRLPNSISKPKNTITKYTRLPDFDSDNKVSWPEKPRLRQVVTVEDPQAQTTRSLKLNVALIPRKMTSNITRKIVTIEDNNSDLHSGNKKTPVMQTINRSVGTQDIDEKLKEISAQHTTTRLSNSLKFSKESALSSAKRNDLNSKCDINSSKLSYKNKYSKIDKQVNVLKKKNRKEDNLHLIHDASPKSTLKSKLTTTSENANDICKLNNDINSSWKRDTFQKKKTNVQNVKKTNSNPNKVKLSTLKEIKDKNEPITLIRVPLDDNKNKHERVNNKKDVIIEDQAMKKVGHCGTLEKNIIYRDVNVGTELKVKVIDDDNGTDEDILKTNTYGNILKYKRSHDILDNLDIPNVSLTNDKSDVPKEEIVNLFTKSLPNLRGPALNVVSLEETQNEQIKKSLFCNQNYIIGRATVTYTSKQKIDFQVVGNHEKNIQPQLLSSPLNYPVNVVSVFKKELAKREYDKCADLREKRNEKDSNTNEQHKDFTSLNYSLVFDSDKLKKPSDIISTIKVNNTLLQDGTVCEQFHRELNFIDSFFESLQYLETCSLSDKTFKENNVEHWINSGYNIDCGTFLSKFENDICVDENVTMASKSLCMLNLLIRHEQRRANNLLFVLKMREDALKDYTKSQILWLENKKKQENTDISTLKKKQRGALLKLQHECGEMQRMRKALLTLSEKRKTAFMKTKKNLEWKLENNLDVEKIILGKKKIKRSNTDRTVAPVKCFDLSSSGCDESTTSRSKSTTLFVDNPPPNILCVEKCVQTGDNTLGTMFRDQSTSTAEEHFVVVDGTYLNILFRDLSLPQIFSGGKQYEVNEEAVANILKSSRSQYIDVSKDVAIDKLMDQIKNHDVDKSSTPSTARSLVEEFDQYYKGMVDEETSKVMLDSNCKTNDDTTDLLQNTSAISVEGDLDKRVCENDEVLEKFSEPFSKTECSNIEPPMEVETSMFGDIDRVTSRDVQGSVAGPLPVPAGAAAVVDPPAPSIWTQHKPIPVFADSGLGISSIASPVSNEAEELRRQQLAIEREIKALEQQQSQFLVVREIPDKPPPPYTPPSEMKPPKTPRTFTVDDTTQEEIKRHITNPDVVNDADVDPYQMFVKDFCRDSMDRYKCVKSDQVWNTCRESVPKPQPDIEQIIDRTTNDLKEVLTCVTPTIVSGVGARRSDHIDDILFAEWRRCEPEWTSLHAEEVYVKNQMFDTIFQRVLTEAIDDFKKYVLTK